MEALEKVAQLKSELDQFRPLKPEAEARIMQKFRLDWNYHSNNIEGNSLTYGETKAFILFGITAGKKPFKDYLEIKGHNEAINWVVDLVKGETELTEVFIRELHTLLLKESSESFAQTPDGKPTKKKIEVGKYKTLPNHVLTATGEMFYFASPEETPAKMHELIDWYRSEREKLDVNPIILATLFHYRFIRIHPFDDGNGRTARILMNFILMQNGFPPAIIKTEDKENYYGVLHLADVGELEPFIGYIAENLIHSLEIMIKGAKGEDIEEPDDLDKELALLEIKLKSTDENEQIEKTRKKVDDLLDEVVFPLIKEFVRFCAKFDRFYLDKKLYSIVVNQVFEPSEFDKFIEALRKTLTKESQLSSFELNYQYNDFINSNFPHLSFTSTISFDFRTYSYLIKIGEGFRITNEIKKSYSENVSLNELYSALENLAKSHKNYIEDKTKTN